MSDDKYAAKIVPVPSIVAGTVAWGWRIELTDPSTDEVYKFEEGAQFPTSAAALKNGTAAIRGYVKSLSEVSTYAVDLYAPDPEPEAPAAEPEKPEQETAPVEEKPAADAPAE